MSRLEFASFHTGLIRLFFLVAGLMLFIPPLQAAQEPIKSTNPFANKTVLLLNSYSEGFGAYEEIIRGFFVGMQQFGGRPEDLLAEKLDLLRFDSTEYKQSLVQLLHKKYAGRKIDLIVTIQKPALDFALAEGRSLFGDTPIIAAFVHGDVVYTESIPHVARLSYLVDFKGSLKHALRFFPETQKVFVIGGIAPTDRLFINQARRDFARWQGPQDFEYLDDGNLEAVLSKVKALPRDSVIIMGTFYRDQSGEIFAHREVYSRIVQHANAPAFSQWDTLISTGIVGGSMVNITGLGIQAAQAAANFLQGNYALEDIRHLDSVPGLAMFEWNQLRRWRADLEELPEESVLLNRPPSLWGQYRWVVVGGMIAILFLSGLVMALVVVNRRRSSAEARYRTLLDLAPEAIGVVDADSFLWIMVNPKMADLTGYSVDELERLPLKLLFDLPQPDGRPISETLREHRDHALSGEVAIFERALKRRDGQCIICEVRVVRLPDTERHLLRSSYIDITERKLAETRLRSSEGSLRAIVDASPMAIAVLSSPEGKVEFTNPRFVELFGDRSSEFFTSSGGWPLAYPDRTYPQSIQNEWDRRIEAAIVSRTKLDPMESQVICKDGSTKTVEWGLIPLDNRDVIYALDLTERVNAEQELSRYRDRLEEIVIQRTRALEEAREQAEAANRAKSVFLSNMSHELRTPLNAVIGFSQLMSKSTHLDETERKNLEIINRSGNHLLTLINDVLELSKIEAGRVEMMESASSLEELAQEVVEMLRPRAEQSGLDLQLVMSDLPPAVLIDTVKLRQILINLVGNAIKFTQAGMIRLSLQGENSCPGYTKVSFSIADTGIGIAPEDQQRIFEPFVQMVTHATASGTGLGLTITRQYLKMLGAELRLDSSLGSGSTFTFTLVLPLTTAERSSNMPRGEVCGPDPRGFGRRILVVEDHADARALLAQLLSPYGFVLAEAEDGEIAVRMAHDFLPDLILMDWRMPHLDGLEATRQIRKLPSEKIPRILMLTASAFEEQRQEALAAGVDDFLRKPLQAEELFAALEIHLAIRFQRNNLAEESADAKKTTTATCLSVDSLQRLSAKEREQLRMAVEELNRSKLASTLTEINVHDPILAQAIGSMADAFRYKELWALLDGADVLAAKT